jgi:hypothetical protein
VMATNQNNNEIKNKSDSGTTTQNINTEFSTYKQPHR